MGRTGDGCVKVFAVFLYKMKEVCISFTPNVLMCKQTFDADRTPGVLFKGV